MHYKQIPEDYAVVLRQIREDGGDDMSGLVGTVQIDRGRLQHIVSSLHHKGLITVEKLGYGTWFKLSTKGRRFVQQVRPEPPMRYQY